MEQQKLKQTYYQKYYAKHKKKLKAYQKEYRKANPVKTDLEYQRTKRVLPTT